MEHAISRPCAGESDGPLLQDLLLACPPVVRSEFPLSDLLYEGEGSTQLWERPAGRAIAAALLYYHSWLLFVVHPEGMGTAAETQVIGWANAQACEFART